MRLTTFLQCALLALLAGCPPPEAPSGDADAGWREPVSPLQDGGTSSDAGRIDAGDLGDAGHPADGGSPFCALSPGSRDGGSVIRILSGNLSSGTQQSYDPGHGLRILQGLLPDVVLLEEFKVGTGSASEAAAFASAALGAPSCWFREAGATLPNGVLSRYPILEAGEWDDVQVSDRDFAYARIDVPGPRDLWAVSVHLLTTGATNRNLEASALVALIQQHVPAGDLLVVGGDFNTDSSSEACLTTLSQVVSTSGPYPADGAGNGNTNAPRSKPYDRILPDADLLALQVPVAIGAQNFAAGLVFDSRVFTPLSAVTPVLLGDSGAPNMQHMAVVKDFLLLP